MDIKFSQKEANIIQSYTYELIKNLPDQALKQILEGYSYDIENLINDIYTEIHRIVVKSNYSMAEFNGLEKLESAFDEQLKILSYNYFKIAMLPNFNMGWRNIEWGNMIQLYHWSTFLASRGSGKSYEFCFAFPLWRLYRYNEPQYLQQDTLDNKLSKETCLITNESRLVKEHLSKIIEEIKINDGLAEKLNPERRDIGIERIKTANGAILHQRTFGSFIRGLHVGAVAVDDFPDESSLYSKEQRSKVHEIFYGSIKSIVEQGGHLHVSGTPYSEGDLYGDLKNDSMFKVFAYPAIYPNGRLLAPDRYSFEHLMNMKDSLGTMVFSREMLVNPVTDQSSLFPYKTLKKSIVGTENISLANNKDSFSIKMKRTVLACDFAISGVINADYSVFSVWGKDSNNNYWLMDCWRKQGASHLEQVNQIVSMNNRHKPNKIIVEDNGFQGVMKALVEERGIRNVEGYTTTSGKKKNDYSGLPSLSAMFERGVIRLPYKVGRSKDTADWLLGEFNSITYDEDKGKLESSGQHDDGVMSSFFGISELRDESEIFKYSWL